MFRKLRNRYQRIKRKWIDGYLMRGWRFNPPKTIILETTNVCSLKCSCCPNGIAQKQLRQHGMMTQDTFDQFLKHLDLPIKQCFLHMCGEPFLNKNLYYFAEQLLAKKIVPVIFSNGYKIDYELLDRLLSLRGIQITFSMDLLSKKHYEQIRKPGKYEDCINSLKTINEIFFNRKRFFGLNIILDSLSILELDSICTHLFAEFSNLNKLSFSSMWPWPNLHQVGDIAGHISKRARLCERIKELPVVLWNGDISFCSFDYSGELIVDNIYRDYISKIYNGKEVRRVRRHLLMGKAYKENFCNNCLLPRYNSLNSVLFRNRYKKMAIEERSDFFQKITNYYNDSK